MACSPETFGSTEPRRKVTSRRISRMSSTATSLGPNSNLSSMTPSHHRPRPPQRELPNHHLTLNLDFAICHLLFAICHLLFAICHLLFAICHLLFAMRHLPFAIQGLG